MLWVKNGFNCNGLRNIEEPAGLTFQEAGWLAEAAGFPYHFSPVCINLMTKIGNGHPEPSVNDLVDSLVKDASHQFSSWCTFRYWYDPTKEGYLFAFVDKMDFVYVKLVLS